MVDRGQGRGGFTSAYRTARGEGYAPNEVKHMALSAQTVAIEAESLIRAAIELRAGREGPEGQEALARFRRYLLDNPRVDSDVRAALVIATGA